MPVFLHTFQRENTYAKLHENAPFEMKNYKNFLGRGTAPLPRPFPHREGGYPSGPHPLGTSVLVPSARGPMGKLPRISSDPRNAPDQNTRRTINY